MEIGRQYPGQGEDPVANCQCLWLSLNFSIFWSSRLTHGLVILEQVEEVVELGDFHLLELVEDAVQVGEVPVQVDVVGVGPSSQPLALSGVLDGGIDRFSYVQLVYPGKILTVAKASSNPSGFILGRRWMEVELRSATISSSFFR